MDMVMLGKGEVFWVRVRRMRSTTTVQVEVGGYDRLHVKQLLLFEDNSLLDKRRWWGLHPQTYARNQLDKEDMGFFYFPWVATGSTS